MSYRLVTTVVCWKGVWHMHLDRVAEATGRRYAPRRRVAEWDLDLPADASDADVLSVVGYTLLFGVAPSFGCRPQTPPSGGAAPLRATGDNSQA